MKNGELQLDLQLALTEQGELPGEERLREWALAALEAAGYDRDCEITVRMVEAEEIQALNREYRKLDRPTNILSFPFECPPQLQLPLLGDLVICDSILRSEALAQHKSYEEHFAHLIIHGTLHLLGYDHLTEDEALDMESLEIAALSQLGYPDPYILK